MYKEKVKEIERDGLVHLDLNKPRLKRLNGDDYMDYGSKRPNLDIRAVKNHYEYNLVGYPGCSFKGIYVFPDDCNPNTANKRILHHDLPRKKNAGAPSASGNSLGIPKPTPCPIPPAGSITARNTSVSPKHIKEPPA